MPVRHTMQNVTLEFTQNYGIYRRGTIANFPPFAAEIIVRAGAAAIVEDAKSSLERRQVKKNVVTK